MPAKDSTPGFHTPRGLDKEVVRGMLPPFLLSGFLIGCAVLLIHGIARVRDLELGRQRALAAARLQATLLSTDLQAIVSEARFVAEDPVVSDFLSARGDSSEIEGHFGRFCSTFERYDQIRLLDLEGNEVVRVEKRGEGFMVTPLERLQSKRDRYYFRRALGLGVGEFYFSRFDLNVEGEAVEIPWKPVVRLATPSVDQHGDVVGILVVNYLSADLLARMRGAALNAPSPTFVVDEEGYYLIGPDQTRSWGFMFGRRPTFAADHVAAWQILSSAGKAEHLDAAGLYVQVPVAGALDDPPGDSDLALRVVTHLPSSLLYANARRTLLWLIGVGLFVWGLLLVACWRLAYAAALRRRHEHELQDSRQSLRNLTAQLLEAQEQERLRLSRDLHDEVGQIATAITIQLKRARKLADPEEKNRLIHTALEGTADLLSVMHRISSSLRASVLADMGLTTAIRAHVEPLQTEGSYHLSLDLSADDDAVDNHVGIHALRVLQEALTNIVRHASATSIDLRTWIQAERLHVLVRDDGCGFDLNARTAQRLGVVGMRERAELLGGELQIDSRAGAGTCVHAIFPLAPLAPTAGDAGLRTVLGQARTAAP